MLDAEKRREIDAHIAMLELAEASYDTYAKLAVLRTLKDLETRETLSGQDFASAPVSAYAEQQYSDAVGRYGDSDFLRAVAGKDAASAWAVMDGLMDTLRAVNIKAYNGVMRRLNAI